MSDTAAWPKEAIMPNPSPFAPKGKWADVDRFLAKLPNMGSAKWHARKKQVGPNGFKLEVWERFCLEQIAIDFNRALEREVSPSIVMNEINSVKKAAEYLVEALRSLSTASAIFLMIAQEVDDESIDQMQELTKKGAVPKFNRRHQELREILLPPDRKRDAYMEHHQSGVSLKLMQVKHGPLMTARIIEQTAVEALLVARKEQRRLAEVDEHQAKRRVLGRKPLVELACRCAKVWPVFTDGSPPSQSYSVDHPPHSFSAFVEVIHEYATGERPDHVMDAVKKAVRSWKRERQSAAFDPAYVNP